MTTFAHQVHAATSTRDFFRMACALTNGRHHDAEDLVASTVLRAIEARDKFRPGTNLGGWLYTIMLNIRRSQHRREYRAVPMTPEVERCLGIAPQPPAQEHAVHLRQVLEKIDGMRAHWRRAILLRRLEGMTVREGAAAGVARVTEHAARMELRRACG